MKVLWVEDHEPVRDMLAIAADKAARARIQVDLVMAATLMEAESRLRLERFDQSGLRSLGRGACIDDEPQTRRPVRREAAQGAEP